VAWNGYDYDSDRHFETSYKNRLKKGWQSLIIIDDKPSSQTIMYQGAKTRIRQL
jgi:hypothetical protein